MFVESDIPADVGAQVRQAVRGCGVMLTKKRRDAGMFVVPEIASPPLATAWASRIFGAGMVAPSFFLKPKGHNAHVQYRRACSTRRRVFVTNSFKAQHPILFKLLVSAEKARGSQWKLIASYEEFVSQKIQAARQSRSCDILAVALKRDKDW